MCLIVHATPQDRHICPLWAPVHSRKSLCQTLFVTLCDMPHILERSPLWTQDPAHLHFLDTFALVWETSQVTYEFWNVGASDIWLKGREFAIHSRIYAPLGSFFCLFVLTVNGFQEDNRKRCLSSTHPPSQFAQETYGRNSDSISTSSFIPWLIRAIKGCPAKQALIYSDFQQ